MLFARLRDWSARICNKAAARPWLYAISFSESIFFPVPVDVALAPIIANQPARWRSITLWCTLYSVAGAVAAYALAAFFWETLLSSWLSAATLGQVQSIAAGLRADGFLVVLISAFTPIPFKLCALSAGVATMSLPVFVLASLLGRGVRYALVAYLVVRFREGWILLMRRYVEPLGIVAMLALAGYLLVSYV